MMSEKRFIFYEYDDGTETIEDTEENEYYHFSNELVGLLNEQQATITHLEKVNGKNFAKRRLLEQDNLILRNENEQLRQTIKEMQQDEQLYANEIVKLNKEAKEVLNFKTLGGDY